MYFSYDANGDILSVRYNGADYYYIKNPQGDVIAICDENENVVDRYTYDEWGKPTSTPTSTIGNLNPFRYRGYIYDNETGFYYVSSRYYDPETGRWLNADTFASTGQDLLGFNMFAYCGNNPINRLDIYGTTWLSAGALMNKVGSLALKTLNALAASFECEIGFGIGLSTSNQAGLSEYSIGGYHDSATFGVDNEKTFTAIKGNAGLKAGYSDYGKIGFSTSYAHYFEKGAIKYRDQHTVFSTPWEVYDCPETEISPPKMYFPIVDIFRVSEDGDMFLGVSRDVHFIVGYHYKVGFDVNEFLNYFSEQ